MQLARTFGYSTDDVNTMESRFLKGIDFTLYLNFEKIHQFMVAVGEQMKKDVASRQGVCTNNSKEEFYKESPEIMC